MEFSATPVLDHEIVNGLVRLEPLSHDHHDALVAAAEADDLWRTWYTEIPNGQAMAAEIDRRLALQADGSMAPWAVVDPRDGRAVGMSTYTNLDPANRRLEIGYTWLATSAQGTGMNPAMKLLMLERAFDELGCVAVEFRTDWHNHQSRAAIAGLGAKQDGVLRQHRIRSDGSLRDTVVFSITDGEWSSVRNGLLGRLRARAYRVSR